MPSSAVPVPPAFLERMQVFLGHEFDAFARSLEAAPASALRVNTLKLSAGTFAALAPAALGAPVPWCPDAFMLAGEARLGRHPYHLAGLFYLQDPSAMSAAQLLAPLPGERVLDLSAAPGGKTTHLAALMHGRGLLVANEIKDKRVGHLAQNVERWGAGNVVVTNETPERLADHLGPAFDRVLVDAPCSGEGMFRKDMGARADWSLEMVSGCAVRQGNILRVAARLVRPGGALLYSTCTFAPEEDEGVIARFLEQFPDFAVEALPQHPGFMAGRPDWLAVPRPGLDGAVRLFPHRLQGEGHFACLLRRDPDSADDRPGRERSVPARRRGSGGTPDLRRWQDFASELLDLELDAARLQAVGERLYYLPEVLLPLGSLRVVHPGVWLGTLKKDRFEPAHPLALFLKPGQARRGLALELDDPRLAAYLRGETIPAALDGWAPVTVSGFALGWGKGVQGTLKNHYPRGWVQA